MYEEQVNKYIRTLLKLKKDLEYLFTTCDQPEKSLFPQTLIKNAYEQYEKVSNTFVEVLQGYRIRESENEVHSQLFLFNGLMISVGDCLDRIDTAIEQQQQLDELGSRRSSTTSS